MAVKFLRQKKWKILGLFAAKKPNSWRIRGRNYGNTQEPNPSFGCKNEAPFLLSIS